MTALDLDAIKLRYCQATPGQWRHGNDGQSVVTDGTTNDVDQEYYVGRVVCESIGQLDAEWIIAARTDVPALVAEVERLRTELVEVASGEAVVVRLGVLDSPYPPQVRSEDVRPLRRWLAKNTTVACAAGDHEPTCRGICASGSQSVPERLCLCPCHEPARQL